MVATEHRALGMARQSIALASSGAPPAANAQEHTAQRPDQDTIATGVHRSYTGIPRMPRKSQTIC